jgi:glutamyl-tRNA synthetase
MLHVGGVRTALFNWLFARKNGGVFVLRIEDTDLARSSEESVEQLKRSLRWIGLEWDEGPEVDGPHAPYRQSERFDLYRERSARLLESGHAYRDFATPEELGALREAAQAEKRQFVYRGEGYRDTDPEEAAAKANGGEPFAVRFKTPLEGRTVVEDLIRGPVTFENANLEDFVIMKSSDTPTYNFAAAVDDAEMRMSHVIRGDDGLSNTPRQILIYKALGSPLPAFAHIPQVLGPDKKKLSKRHGAASVEEFAERGYLPEALFNYLALLGAGYAADEEVFSPHELAERFRVERVSGNPAVFDEKKLASINAVYLRKQSPEELAMVAAPMLAESGAATPEELQRDMPRLTRIMALLRDRLSLTSEIPAYAGYFYGGTLDYDGAEFKKQLDKDFVREALPELLGRLEALPEQSWTEEALEEAIRGLADEKDVKARHLISPMRFVATGRTVSAGLFETLALLGRERTISRLEKAVEELERLPAA